MLLGTQRQSSGNQKATGGDRGVMDNAHFQKKKGAGVKVHKVGKTGLLLPKLQIPDSEKLPAVTSSLIQASIELRCKRRGHVKKDGRGAL